MFGREELERMRRKLQRRVIVSGVAMVLVLGAACFLGRRQSPGATPGATIDAQQRDNEMAHHHAGR